jgi:drug/metabolite transporter (DMT)-like permease
MVKPRMIWIGLLVLAAAAIAGGHILAALALRRVDVRSLLLGRSLAGLLVVPLAFLVDGFEPIRQATPGQWGTVGLMLVTSMSLSIVFFVGVLQGGVGPINALRQNTAVVLLVASAAMSQTLPGTFESLGGLLIVAGSGLLVVGGGGRMSRRSAALGIASAVLTAAVLSLQDAVLLFLPKLWLVAVHAIGMSVLAVLLVMSRRAGDVSPVPRDARAHRFGFGLALGSGLMIMVVCDLLKFVALPHVGPTIAAAVMLSYLPMAAFMERFFLGRPTSRGEVLAMGVIVAGAVGIVLD